MTKSASNPTVDEDRLADKVLDILDKKRTRYETAQEIVALITAAQTELLHELDEIIDKHWQQARFDDALKDFITTHRTKLTGEKS